MKRLSVALLLAALALAACKQEPSASPAGDPDAKPGLSAAHGRLVLPAVKGNPAAAYFDVTNAGPGPTSLANVVIDGVGKTELHEMKDGSMTSLHWVQLEPGATVSFAPGGKHVMAFDVEDRLAAGGKTEMTLVFSDGDKLSAQIDILAPGQGAAGTQAPTSHESAH